MTIDTSTTAGKIAVMQHYEDGGSIQARFRDSDDVRWSVPESKLTRGEDVTWDWRSLDFRIEPKPREFTLLIDDSGMILNDYEPSRSYTYAQRIKVREVIE